jgi:Spy/CpxP family protein refolding chaperone
MFRKLLLAVMLAAALAYAQRGGGGGMGGDMGGGGGMGGMMSGMPRAARQSKADQLAGRLKLDKEQKEQLQTIFSVAREKVGPIRTELDKARAQIAGAMIDGKSEDDVQKMLSAYSGLVVQMTSLQAETFSKIYAMLKPNQQSRAAHTFDLMAGVLEESGGGRGAGIGRGRGEAR